MKTYKDGDIFWARCVYKEHKGSLSGECEGAIIACATNNEVFEWCDSDEYEKYFLGDLKRGLIIPTNKSLEKKAKEGKVNQLKIEMKLQESLLKWLKDQIRDLEV